MYGIVLREVFPIIAHKCVFRSVVVGWYRRRTYLSVHADRYFQLLCPVTVRIPVGFGSHMKVRLTQESGHYYLRHWLVLRASLNGLCHKLNLVSSSFYIRRVYLCQHSYIPGYFPVRSHVRRQSSTETALDIPLGNVLGLLFRVREPWHDIGRIYPRWWRYAIYITLTSDNANLLSARSPEPCVGTVFVASTPSRWGSMLTEDQSWPDLTQLQA